MEKLKNLETILAQLEEQRDLNDNTAINSSIRDTKQEKYKNMDDRTRRAHIRCRVRWYEEGDKRNYNNKVINKL